jgi:hypothetical protein
VSVPELIGLVIVLGAPIEQLLDPRGPVSRTGPKMLLAAHPDYADLTRKLAVAPGARHRAGMPPQVLRGTSLERRPAPLNQVRRRQTRADRRRTRGRRAVRGSVVKRGKTYAVVVELDRDPTTGKRRQKWHSGYRTKHAAERALAEQVDAINRGGYVPKTRQTVAEFASEWPEGASADRPRRHARWVVPAQRRLRPHDRPKAVQGRRPMGTASS